MKGGVVVTPPFPPLSWLSLFFFYYPRHITNKGSLAGKFSLSVLNLVAPIKLYFRQYLFPRAIDIRSAYALESDAKIILGYFSSCPIFWEVGRARAQAYRAQRPLSFAPKGTSTKNPLSTSSILSLLSAFALVRSSLSNLYLRESQSDFN